MKTRSAKSYGVAVCLSAIFGIIGIQHFYLERYLLGSFDVGLSLLALYCVIAGQPLYALFFFLIDWVHSIIVTIQLLTWSFEDGEGHIVCYPGQKLN
jgi:hypothetical protein